MTLSESLGWRGFIKDKTFDDTDWLDEPRTFYLGSDCSSDSLTIGNLAVYMLARHLADAGWKTVLLVGGATSLIGDPGGKDAERPLKTTEEIAHNVAGVEAQVRKLFAHNQFELVNNHDWFKDIGYLEFLREVGKHFSMTELTQRDFIATRMGEGGGGISYAEFSYNLIQGYDYYWLFKNKGVVLQIGASDQWGNMLSGVPLIRKKAGAEVHALCMPLVIDQKTGKKFGKSEAGAVWLDPSKTTPTQFYQFWINVEDNRVEDFLKLYTLLSKENIEKLMQQHREEPKLRLAQEHLAMAVTQLVHGDLQTSTAREVTEVIKNPQAIALADRPGVLESLRKEIASASSPPDGKIADALTAANLAESKTEARRLLADGAITINGTRVIRERFEPGDFQ